MLNNRKDFYDLPAEIIEHIFSFLGTQEWIRIAQINIFFYRFIDRYCQSILSSRSFGINEELKIKYEHTITKLFSSRSITLVKSISRIPHSERNKLTLTELHILGGDEEYARRALKLGRMVSRLTESKIILYLLLGNHRQLYEKLVSAEEHLKIYSTVSFSIYSTASFSKPKKEIGICDEDLSNYDLSFLDLSNIIFQNNTLIGTNFKKCNLKNTHFIQGEMKEVDFSEAHLIKTKFKKVTISGNIYLTGATIIEQSYPSLIYGGPENFSRISEYIQIDISLSGIEHRLQYIMFFLNKYRSNHYTELHNQRCRNSSFNNFLHLDASGYYRECCYLTLLTMAKSHLQQKIAVYALLSDREIPKLLKDKIVNYLGYEDGETTCLVEEIKYSIIKDLNNDKEQFSKLEKEIIKPLYKTMKLGFLSRRMSSFYDDGHGEDHFSSLAEVVKFKHTKTKIESEKKILRAASRFNDEIVYQLKNNVLNEIQLIKVNAKQILQEKLEFYKEIFTQANDVTSILMILYALLHDKELSVFLEINNNSGLVERLLGSEYEKPGAIISRTTAHLFPLIIMKTIESKLNFDTENVNLLHQKMEELIKYSREKNLSFSQVVLNELKELVSHSLLILEEKKRLAEKGKINLVKKMKCLNEKDEHVVKKEKKREKRYRRKKEEELRENLEGPYRKKADHSTDSDFKFIKTASDLFCQLNYFSQRIEENLKEKNLKNLEDRSRLSILGRAEESEVKKGFEEQPQPPVFTSVLPPLTEAKDITPEGNFSVEIESGLVNAAEGSEDNKNNLSPNEEKGKEVEGRRSKVKSKKYAEKKKVESNIKDDFESKHQPLPRKQNTADTQEQQRSSRFDKIGDSRLWEFFEILCKLPLEIFSITLPTVLIEFNIGVVAQSCFSFFGGENQPPSAVKKTDKPGYSRSSQMSKGLI